MAIKMGTENKRQVYLAIGLFVVIIGLGIYEFTGSSNKPNTVPKQVANPTQARPGAAPSLLPPTVANRPGTPSGTPSGTQSAPAAEKVSSLNIDPALHLTRLSYTESILYEGHGRNIFSADSVPTVDLETPLASGRQDNTRVADQGPVVPEKPHAPPIDLKYFGYTMTKDKTFRAFFVRGDDIFTAHSGEIVDHRYKVGTISAVSVQLTDLNYNNTQSVPLTGGNAVANRN